MKNKIRINTRLITIKNLFRIAITILLIFIFIEIKKVNSNLNHQISLLGYYGEVEIQERKLEQAELLDILKYQVDN